MFGIHNTLSHSTQILPEPYFIYGAITGQYGEGSIIKLYTDYNEKADQCAWFFECAEFQEESVKILESVLVRLVYAEYVTMILQFVNLSLHL